LRDELAAAGVLYLGDDVTDEDGFRALGPDDVTVKIGDGDTAARHRVGGPADALGVLERLVDLLS
jgi:trehalose 6-phosphate phosphatase